MRADDADVAANVDADVDVDGGGVIDIANSRAKQQTRKTKQIVKLPCSTRSTTTTTTTT